VDRQGPRTPAAAASAPADGIFRACAHFYLHLFDTVGGVRMYTRIQSVGMKKVFNIVNIAANKSFAKQAHILPAFPPSCSPASTI
jgi:hypothetical protein